jgi:uncharacterized protein (DUF2141 family)
MQASAADLTVEIQGIKPATGHVVIAVYNNAKDFPVPEKRMTFKSVVAENSVTSVTFADLEPGRYAVVAYQDENNNGKLDKNLLGVPSEPYGFSNHARGRMGPPSFDAAAVDLSSNMHVSIDLH